MHGDANNAQRQRVYTIPDMIEELWQVWVGRCAAAAAKVGSGEEGGMQLDEGKWMERVCSHRTAF